MDLHFEPITDDNRERALKLHISPTQKGYVETVEECLEEASHGRNWQPVGIYDGPVMVGFAMYGFFWWPYLPLGRLWLDRLLIDEAFQGRGYGSAALSGLLDRLQQEYRCRRIYLSVIRENSTAITMYEKFGFRFTGERDIPYTAARNRQPVRRLLPSFKQRCPTRQRFPIHHHSFIFAFSFI